MQCKICERKIPNDSLFCKYCGADQQVHPKRANGTGTINIDTRYRNRYIVHAPAHGKTRLYIGAFPTLDKAEKALSEYIKKRHSRLRNATVNDVYEAWSDTHFTHICEKTAKSYKSAWKHFEPIKNILMSEIRTADLQDIVNAHSGVGVSRGIKTLAKALCKYAMENDIIDKNYADFIQLPKTERAEKLTFTSEQIAALWKHSDDKRVRIILVMIYMGFRISELLELKRDNVHLEKGYIRGGKKTAAGRDRIIPFPPNIPEIKEFVAEWIPTAGENGTLLPYKERAFRINVFYAPLIQLGMIDAYINKNHNVIFASPCHLTPHSTRHTFASLSVAAGMRPEYLQRIIGHARFHTTADVYVHLTDEMLIQEMGKLINGCS